MSNRPLDERPLGCGLAPLLRLEDDTTPGDMLELRVTHSFGAPHLLLEAQEGGDFTVVALGRDKAKLLMEALGRFLEGGAVPAPGGDAPAEGTFSAFIERVLAPEDDPPLARGPGVG